MKQPNTLLGASLFLLAGILVGTFTSGGAAQDPVRVKDAAAVNVYTNRTALDLAEIMFAKKVPRVAATTLKEIFDKVDGRARSGDLTAALVMYRLSELQGKAGD